MKKKFAKYFLIVVGIIFSVSFISPKGSGPAILTGVSNSGRTHFYASIENFWGPLDNANYKIDNDSILFDASHAVAVVIISWEDGVYTLNIQGDSTENFRFIRLYAIPSTFKEIKTNTWGQHYEFKAKIFGSDPKSSNGFDTSDEIELNCKLDYTI